MKAFIAAGAIAAIQILTQQVAMAEDVTLGHVSLPKGKYVLTNTETHSTIVINVDGDGLVKGPKPGAAPAAAAAPVAAPAAAPAAVAPAAAPVAAAAAAAGAPHVPGKTSALTNMVMGEAKKQAMKAITGGQVKGLMKKVGVDKVLH